MRTDSKDSSDHVDHVRQLVQQAVVQCTLGCHIVELERHPSINSCSTIAQQIDRNNFRPRGLIGMTAAKHCTAAWSSC